MCSDIAPVHMTPLPVKPSWHWQEYPYVTSVQFACTGSQSARFSWHSLMSEIAWVEGGDLVGTYRYTIHLLFFGLRNRCNFLLQDDSRKTLDKHCCRIHIRKGIARLKPIMTRICTTFAKFPAYLAETVVFALTEIWPIGIVALDVIFRWT